MKINEKRLPIGGQGLNSNNELMNYIDFLYNLNKVVCTNDNSYTFKTINYDRYLINNGRMYQAGNDYPSLAFGNKIIAVYQTPIGYKTHIKDLRVSAEGATLKVSLINGVTYNPTGNGLDITEYIRNLNDNYPTYHMENYEHGKIYIGVSNYSGGYLWKRLIVHGSTTNQSVGSGDVSDLADVELITKNDGTFNVLEIENIDEGLDTAYNIIINFRFYDTEC